MYLDLGRWIAGSACMVLEWTLGPRPELKGLAYSMTPESTFSAAGSSISLHLK